MGQAKIKQRAAFAPQLIEEWEADDCVNFAVGLARMTGWLLHVDWWSTSTTHVEDMPLDQLTPLRAYVADNHDRIFDVRGIRSIREFNQNILFKLIRQNGLGNGGVYTRFYDEAKLSSLPLKSPLNETKIARAIEAIWGNPQFFAAVPARTQPGMPAHKAAQYSYGHCAAFALALHELTGLEPVALLAVRFSPLFEGTRRSESGFFHSVVLHPDGLAEDAWGKASLDAITNRFGVIEYKASSEEHRRVVEKIQQSSHDVFEMARKDALDSHGPIAWEPLNSINLGQEDAREMHSDLPWRHTEHDIPLTCSFCEIRTEGAY